MSIDFWENNKMIRILLVISLLFHAPVAQKLPAPQNFPTVPDPVKRWPTLSGEEPIVMARGGASGLFPEGSPEALELANDLMSIFFCNLQFSKEGEAFCLTGITLDNATSIAMLDPKEKTYNVNGREVRGHFPFDYTTDDIGEKITLAQAIFSRCSFYDGASGVLSVNSVLGEKNSKINLKFWLNIQNAELYIQHGIKVEEIVLGLARRYPDNIEFVSSSDMGLMKSISGKLNKSTRAIFNFLDADDVEPMTRQPYGTVVKDLVTIKSFASGIMVTKDYIWPLTPDKYLGLPTTLVTDAHRQGLEVYVSGFANDIYSSYSYNYDPTAEYLQFIDHGDSVDGFVSDFPETAANAIECFALNNTLPQKGPTLIISNNGASGVYPACTDLAYQQAIDDGADIIDCSVQVTKDDIVFCSNAADLKGETNAFSKFPDRSSTIAEIQPKVGVYSFDLTWSEIQALKPEITGPKGPGFQRNPANKNSGKFVTLSEFLELAKAKTGILVNIQNAAYLASKKNFDIVGAVRTALSNATFDKQVLIQSDDSSVLSKFKDIPSYKRVMLFKDPKGDIPRETAEEIKKYADAVNLNKFSIFKTDDFSLTFGISSSSKVLKDANLTLFVHTFKNEFLSMPFDFQADPNTEIATYIHVGHVDGIITDFPATASRYMRSPCSDPNHDPAIIPANPGDLWASIPAEAKPPAAAPVPPIAAADVVDPPIPSVTNQTKPAEPGASPSSAPSSSEPSSSSSGGTANIANFGLSLVAISVLVMLFTEN